MGNFIKAIFISAFIMAMLFYSAHFWGGLNVVIDGHLIEPILALGVVMVSVIVSIFIAALVIAGVFGSIMLVGGFVACIVAFFAISAMLFSGLFISWPVVIAAIVIWLLVRDKPNKNKPIHY